ncbi:hypothetical protein VAR608DRAFT_5905 [Variovorax sp. HW608]|uniref:hypothetical protein n=1 Tax=Variovorax sp. HW608 TaxID=1034889 RepID=UPI00081FFDE2|nr:hypothetical protein [Variovorax sp. HW608]SCK56655.1 hypothetical protein VAR608DRAFT_5905 [Variovorax sp. HW608]
MDKESKSGSSLPSNGIVAIVLLAAGVLFVREVPLETTRLPVNEPRLEQHYAKQDIDARLWQDPFGAVARYRTDLRKNGQGRLEGEDRLRTAEELAKDVADVRRRFPPGEDRQVQVLAVMLPGGPYSENVESRRRGRYAVLAGLNASRLSPVDTEHLGYFTPPEAAGARVEKPSPEPIPYEWFQPASDVVAPQDLSRSSLQSPVLVMWLQTEAFATRPLEHMAQLARPFVDAGASWRVLGPNGSDGLKAMIDEVGDPDFASQPVHAAMRFYSLYATVPDEVLLEGRNDLKERGDGAVSKFFASRHIALVRTIGNDGALADALIAELKLRGLDPRRIPRAQGDNPDVLRYQDLCRMAPGIEEDVPSRIAIVAEWDTLYGRSLLREFRAKQDEPGFCVERFSYVRGLDGQLPAAADSGAANGGTQKQSQPEKDPGRRKDGTFIEVAEGQGQFDYLRRLAVQMRMKDELLRSAGGDKQGFRAIGVLGNDVHDKLLVLQALRPEFPNAIFFTTDMDARLMHPREQNWTRNLIVASNFGLRLMDRLQGGAPPFRDSYQVSAFLSTRLAMDDARRKLQLDESADGEREPMSQKRIRAWFETPRIFEIGRTGAYDFTGSPSYGSNRKGCRGVAWSECDDIHPAGSRAYPAPGVPVMFLIFMALMLLLWVPPLFVSEGARNRLTRTMASRDNLAARPRRWAVAVLILLVVQVALPLWMAVNWEPFAEWLTDGGKPMLAIEGISLWPTEAIRIFTLLLCFYLLYRGWATLNANLEEIAAHFDAGVARQELKTTQDRADRRLRAWRKLGQVFSMRFIPPLHEHTGDVAGMTPDAVDFWGRHIVQNRLLARLVRTASCVLIAAALSSLLILAIGEVRFVPQRGGMSLLVHESLRIPALLMMYFLVFFVVDATVLCVRFVRGLLRLRRLHEYAANWPEATLRRFEAQMGMPRAYLENWIDLQFVARRTRSVTRLIYYPFIVISLWLLSRSAVFDHWTLSVGTVVPAAIGAAVALGCAVALRLAAEDSRKHALEQVKNEILRVSGAPPSSDPDPAPTVKQLELLQSRIEDLHEGAFAPFWQQPLLKALLLPFATLGGTTVLDYMALANI